MSSIAKEQVTVAIKKLPPKFSVDLVIDELILFEKIEMGLAQFESNNVIPDEELDKELPEWLK